MKKICNSIKAAINSMPCCKNNTNEVIGDLYHGLRDKESSFGIIAVRCDNIGKRDTIPIINRKDS